MTQEGCHRYQVGPLVNRSQALCSSELLAPAFFVLRRLHVEWHCLLVALLYGLACSHTGKPLLT